MSECQNPLIDSKSLIKTDLLTRNLKINEAKVNSKRVLKSFKDVFEGLAKMQYLHIGNLFISLHRLYDNDLIRS